MIVLHFSMQGEDIVEQTNGKCHVFTFKYAREKYFLNILMPSVICVHFSQLIDHCVTLLNILMPIY